MARGFAKSGIKTKRSVLFILFSNEESGLIGSTNYCKHPVLPLEKTVCMMNLDCVGYGDSIQIGNGKSSPNLWKIAKQCNDGFIKSMVERTWNGGGADATPFHNEGIPCLYVVTTNSYEHLHLTTDKPETLNGQLYEKITRLAYITARQVANGEYKKEEIIK